MPTRIHVLQRIIQAVAIAVESLRVGGIGYYGIRADEPAYCRIVVAGVVEIEAAVVQPLAGVVIPNLFRNLREYLI